MDVKWCIYCGEFKPLVDFNKRSREKDGHNYYCRDCEHKIKQGLYALNPEHAKQHSKERYYANKEQEDARSRAYYYTHQDEMIDRARQWYLDNKERHDATCDAWEQAHKPEMLEWYRNYRKEHPEYATNGVRKRRARKRNVVGNLKIRQWRWLLEVCDYRCLKCGTREEITLDHISPLDPGTHTLDNIQPLCLDCNIRKHRKLIDYRPQWLKDLVDEIKEQFIYYGRITYHTSGRLLPSTHARIGI